MNEMNDGRVVVAGASGLIGRALVESLRSDGMRVVELVRRPAQNADEHEWLTETGSFGPDVLAGAAAVVCLNGASIGRLPWTPAYKHTLRESRIVPARAIATALRGCGDEAPFFACASAVGFYGDRPGELLDEESAVGDTFLAELCREWEGEALAADFGGGSGGAAGSGDPAGAAGSAGRVALLRTAPLLHREGVLKPLIALTRLGVSGPLGTGEQVWPWISLDDEVRAIRHIIDLRLAGPVNLCGPTPATANEIGRELASAMGRPFVVPAPAFALRAALGGAAADSLLLADATVAPSVLLDTGFEFSHPSHADAIAAALAE